jgi:hypothetical protein
MREKELNTNKFEKESENKEKKNAISSEELLSGLEENKRKEEDSLSKITERVQNDSSLMKESDSRGFFRSLSEKAEKNRSLRAVLVALSLCAASPATASEIEVFFDQAKVVVESKPSAETKNGKEEFEMVPESHRGYLSQIYESAPEETQKIIIDELENGQGIDSRKLSGGEDPEILILQQKIIDSQNSGEMGLRRKGGVILPFDKEHSRETKDIEYANDEIAEGGGKQTIKIENASENQIRAWVNYLKTSKK